MSFQVITVSEGGGVDCLEGVFASQGYFDEVPGSYAVYRQNDGQYFVEEFTGDPDLPATTYPL